MCGGGGLEEEEEDEEDGVDLNPGLNSPGLCHIRFSSSPPRRDLCFHIFAVDFFFFRSDPTLCELARREGSISHAAAIKADK